MTERLTNLFIDIASAIREKSNGTNLISAVAFPNAIKKINVDADAFDKMLARSFKNIELNNVTEIGSYAFAGCSSLTSISFPACKSINTGAFTYCASLSSINLPVCEYVGSSAFAYCSSALTSVYLPTCTSLGSYAFEYCNSLTSINLPVCTCIHNYAFLGCENLISVTLGASSVVTLRNNYEPSPYTYIFQATPIAESYYTGSFGSIYVPESLVTYYKRNSYWSLYSSRITAIP